MFLPFTRVPSHNGIPGIEWSLAALAAAVRTSDPIVITDKFTDARLLLCARMRTT